MKFFIFNFIYLIYKMNNTYTNDIFQNLKNAEINHENNTKEQLKSEAANNIINNNNLQESILDMNEKLRTDLKLSLAIYKKINNIEYNYIRNIFKNGN
jgi:hypothetical protein